MPVHAVGEPTGGQWYTQIHRAGRSAASLGQLGGDRVTAVRPVPPRADRDERVTDEHGVAVGQYAATPSLLEPQSGAFAIGVLTVEIVVAGADDEAPGGVQQVEVLQHHHGLGVEGDSRGDVQLIAGHHHEVEVGRTSDDPIELRQGVVEVGDQK